MALITGRSLDGIALIMTEMIAQGGAVIWGLVEF